MSTTTCLLGTIALVLSASASAAEPTQQASATPTFEELPEPSIALDRLPPRYSWELGLALSYGAVDHWQEYFDAWVGFGARTGWGRNFGNSRLGFDVHAVIEGPVGVHTTLGLEPHLSWDHISNGNLLIGAGVGPAVLYHMATGESAVLRGERSITLEPSIVGRIGYSQTWTRVGRRMFVYLEPKLRPSIENTANGRMIYPNPVIALVVGSGRGR